ncbi:type IV secretion system protein, partial [Neisseria sp. P0015.S010]
MRPIFILCLLFKKTAPLFQKWLYYGLATIFSSVMLGVMAEISMDLVGNIAITDAVSNIASALIGGNVGGIMQ